MDPNRLRDPEVWNSYIQVPNGYSQTTYCQRAAAQWSKCLDDSPKILILSNFYLIELPPEVWCLTELEQLHIWGNRLEYIPVDVCKLINLKGLHCYGNNLTNLPFEIVELEHIEVVYCVDCDDGKKHVYYHGEAKFDDPELSRIANESGNVLPYLREKANVGN